MACYDNIECYKNYSNNNANQLQQMDEGDDDPSGGIIMETNLLPRLVSPEKNNALPILVKPAIRG